jgi:hypothetical protein
MTVHNPNVLFAQNRRGGAVLAALRQAIDLQRQSGSGSRVFIVRTHVVPDEQAAWSEAFTALHVHPRVVRIGTEHLEIIDPAA